jgi:hypothetical protein
VEEITFSDFLFSFAQILSFLALYYSVFDFFFKKTFVKSVGISIFASQKQRTLLLFNARIAQLIEHNLAKVGVASLSLVSRSSVIEVYPFVQ